MKWTLFLLFLSFSLSAQSVPTIQISELNLDYLAPKGEGTARNMLLPHTSWWQGELIKVFVEKKDDGLELVFDGGNFHFGNLPKIIMEGKEVMARNLNLEIDRENSFLNFETLKASTDKDELVISKLELNCNQGKSMLSDILEQCSLNNRGRLQLYRSTNKTDSKITEFKDVVLSTNNHQFNLNLRLESPQSGKVQAKGEINYVKNEHLLKVKIDQVKFGILNITGQVFKELEKNQNDKIKVNRPWVLIKI